MDNKIIKYIFIVIVIFLVIFAIYRNKNDETEYENEVIDQTSTASTIQPNLRFAICNFDTINPILTNNRNVQEISKIIYEPLVTLNNNYKAEYCLAKEIAKIDEYNYVVKLRDDVKWQNGLNFSANDVKYTIDVMKSGINTVYASNIDAISGLEKVDDNTVKITLSYPVDFFEYNLTFPILCEQDFVNEDFATGSNSSHPSGTGLYKILSIDENIIKLEENKSYWNKEKKLMTKEIDINLYNSAGEMYEAFKNGNIDILDIKISNIENYIGTLGYKKIEFKSRDYDFLAFNTTNPILSDKAVRQAISKIIDKNNIIASCLGGGYVSSNISLDMGKWIYTKDVSINPDLNSATEILVNDGWEYKNNQWTKKIDNKKTELTFSILVNTSNQLRVNVAENIIQQLSNFGIDATIKYYNNESFNNAVNNKNYDIVLTGIRCGYSPSIDTFVNDDNLALYDNSEVDDILNVISNTTVETEIYEKYNRLFDIYLDDVPYIGLYRNTNCVVFNQNLVGNIQANDFNIYYNIDKWYRQ